MSCHLHDPTRPSSGPGNPFSNTVGFPWVNAVKDLFVAGPGKTVSGATFVPPPLIMGFTVRDESGCVAPT